MGSKIKTYFHFGEDKPEIYYRPGTSDEAVMQEIFSGKAYLFPQFEAAPPAIIYDIGANIGIAAVMLANTYPTAQIHAFEPEMENFAFLCMNAEAYEGRIYPHNYALGMDTEQRTLFPSDDPLNFGGFSTTIDPGTDEDFTHCDMRAVDEVCLELGVPDLIKIDAEGAEHEILTSMRLSHLAKVRFITGEMHSRKDFHLLAFLDQWFHIRVAKDFNSKIYPFHCINRAMVSE